MRLLLSLLVALAVAVYSTSAIKFDLPVATHPHSKCIWNYALADTLVIVTANTVPGEGHSADGQRVDIEVIDGSKHNNVYLSKKNIKGETRLAINTHSHADLGVCFKNTGHCKCFYRSREEEMEHDDRLTDHETIFADKGNKAPYTVVDLDVDIGADAVDYNAIANQESLSGLETEMRKLEAVANEILNEMDYLRKREERMRDTNRKCHPCHPSTPT